MATVEWVEAPTRRDFVEVAALLSDFWREVLPDEPDQSAEELESEMVIVPAHRQPLLAVASEKDAVVGVSRSSLMDIEGRRTTAEADFFVVRPESRRRGVGTRLLGLLAHRARNAGRVKIRAFAPVTPDSGSAFASRSGAMSGLVDCHNRLRVDQLDRRLLESWVERASDRAHGYSIVTFDGECPDRWLAPFAKLVGVMNTAPRTEGEEDWVLTPEQLHEREAVDLRRGFWTWRACALHDDTGELVGFTELGASKYRPWLGMQGDTGVEPAHRDRGLGRWLKAVNALRLLDERPEVTVIDTWNAGVNAPMLSINEAMGYRRIGTWQEWVLALS